MRKLLGIICLLLALGLVVFGALWVLGGKKESSQGGILESYHYLGLARGFLVTTGEGGDFPSRSGMTDEELQQELDEIVAFAVENHFNSIFFEARPGGTAFYKEGSFPLDSSLGETQLDPLEYLCTQAQQNRIQVFAVLETCSAAGTPVKESGPPKNFKDQLISQGDGLWFDLSEENQRKALVEDAAAVARKYEVAGVVLDGLDLSFAQDPAQYADGLEKLIIQAGQEIRKVDEATHLAIAFDGGSDTSAMTPELVSRLTEAGTVTMVIPAIQNAVDAPSNDYLTCLHRWTGAMKGEAELYTRNGFPEDGSDELGYQLFINTMESSVSGAVLSSYSGLRDSGGETELLVGFLSAGKGQVPQFDLSYPQTLAITYPAGNVTVTSDAIYVMGTSDPDQPLMMDGEELERETVTGLFGVKVDLETGDNVIRLTQNGQEASVTVTKTSGSGSGTISGVTTSSIFPTVDLGVDSNSTIQLSCVGPAGAEINATIGGQAVILQPSSSASKGTPVTYSGSFTLDPDRYSRDEVTNIGSVTYLMEYDGGSSVYHSEGEILVAGWNVPLTVEVQPYVASVLSDPDNDDTIVDSLKQGARATVTGRYKTSRSGSPVMAYKLSTGGYILSTKTSVITDVSLCTSEVTEITTQQQQDQEVIRFQGAQSAMTVHREGDALTVRLLNTTLSADPSVIAGGMVSQVEQSETGDGVSLTLQLAEPSDYWGYDVTYEENCGVLTLFSAPSRSQTYGKPLAGISVMLDPGHGGADPGALGVAGTTGPTEAQLNLAVAQAARYRLEQLGATVYMTRTDDTQVSLDERCLMAQEKRPDLFMSIHHNSAALTSDLGDAQRMEVYYFEEIAQPFAQYLMDELGAALGRNVTEPKNDYYYVTRLSFSPAVLFEMGFVVNPQEYESACSSVDVYKSACAIARAVLEMIPQQ